MVPIHLEVPIVPDIGASVLSVGALHDKGVNLVYCLVIQFYLTVTTRFPFQRKLVPRMLVLHILLDRIEEPQHIPNTAVHVAPKHESLPPSRVEAEELAAGGKGVDRSGAAKLSEIG